MAGREALTALGDKALLATASPIARIGENDGMSPPLGMASLPLVMGAGARNTTQENPFGKDTKMQNVLSTHIVLLQNKCTDSLAL